MQNPKPDAHSCRSLNAVANQRRRSRLLIHATRPFRIDSFVASFGSADNFYRNGDETHYKEWLGQKIKNHPGSAVHVYLDGQIIGQMELGKSKADPEIGAVFLYYLAPAWRGQNLSSHLDRYATKFLRGQACKVARLNVSPTNTRAIRFYLKNGWHDAGQNPKHPEVQVMEKNLTI